MNNDTRPLPLGEAEFTNLRSDQAIYVDKTALLLQLIQSGRWYFLSRPRRFGKTLTVSTLAAMFQGKAAFFSDLAAYDWVALQSRNPAPVLRFDFSLFDIQQKTEDLDAAFTLFLNQRLAVMASDYEIALTPEASAAATFLTLLEKLSRKNGQVVVLIDEYDAPILHTLTTPERANQLRACLRPFYNVLKGCSACLRFVFISGITKFVKTGIFSSLNNLHDISLNEKYATLVGYTSEELRHFFAPCIQEAARKLAIPDITTLENRIRKFYDGYSFDGIHKVYNPFSILSFFEENRFGNFWYETGSPAYIEEYFKTHTIDRLDAYENCTLREEEIAPREIEHALPKSFLYQAGYLTIVRKTDQALILDYPNEEVRTALSILFLDHIYQLPDSLAQGKALWDALKRIDCQALAKTFNSALASIPYYDFTRADEYFYRSLFLMLLRGASIRALGEQPSSRGRSDVVIETDVSVLVIEFKLAQSEAEVAQKQREGERQIYEKGYLEPYASQKKSLKACVFVIDKTKRQVVF